MCLLLFALLWLITSFVRTMHPNPSLCMGCSPLLQESTPLHWAAECGHLEVVEAMLGAGAAVDAVEEVNPPASHLFLLLLNMAGCA